MPASYDTPDFGSSATGNTSYTITDSDIQTAVNSHFQNLLGRDASQQEMQVQKDYVTSKKGSESLSTSLGGIEGYLKSTDEYQRRQQTLETTKGYESRAPLRNQMFGNLYDMIQGNEGAAKSTLENELNQRGILSSGSLGYGLVDIYGQGQRSLVQGGQSIAMEDYKQALDQGNSLRNYMRAQQMQKNQFDQQQKLANQEYAFRESQKGPQKQWWENLLGMGGVALGSAFGGPLGGYLGSLFSPKTSTNGTQTSYSTLDSDNYG